MISTICLALYACNNGANKSLNEAEEFTDNTNVIVKWDSSCRMNESYSYLNGSHEILLTLYDTLYNKCSYDFEFRYEDEKWKVLLNQPTPSDCLYVSPQFNTIQQSIKLNKSEYKKGDKLQGIMNLLILAKKGIFREPEIPFIDLRKWDTVNVSGNFSSTIQ